MLIAVNGWILTQSPHSPLAAHTRELLRRVHRLEPSHHYHVFHPPGAPGDLPVGIEAVEVPARASEWGRLIFEQRDLPRAAARRSANVLLTSIPAVPLASPVPVVAATVSPASSRRVTAAQRLRWALGRAGARGAAGRLQFSDLPSTEQILEPLSRLPPSVGAAFRATAETEDRAVLERYGLQAGYVLCYGAEPEDLALLLAAWTWVEGSTGDSYPLVLLGLEGAAAARVREEASRLDIVDSVRVVPGAEDQDLPALYRGAETFLHPGYTTWGQELRWALASGAPVASLETPQTASILGEAGYLVAPGDSRALGAACLTLLVEPAEVARPLREKGLLRARDYHGDPPLKAFLQALEQAVTR